MRTQSTDRPRWFVRLGRGLDRAFRRLLIPQSAFTIGDLLNVARADESDAPLDPIYEWYFTRTMNAIRTSFAAAGAIFLTLYRLVDESNSDPSNTEPWLSRGLALAAVGFAMAGVYQMRELAQLHREFAVALRLLTEVRKRSNEALSRSPTTYPEPSSSALRGYVIAGLVVLAIGMPICLGVSDPETALAVAAVLGMVALQIHFLAEVWPHEPRRPIDAASPPKTLEDAVGHYRLDEYVLNMEVTQTVDRAIHAIAERSL